jgi:guanylate kinase
MLMVLSGPSGVGKDSVLRYLRSRVPDVCVPVTATTRPPRPGEVPGKSYYFLSQAEFDARLKAGELLAAARVHGNWYGLPVEELREPVGSGQDVIVKIDVQGAMDIKRRLPQAVFVFLAPPSFEELVRRLQERNTESPETLKRRVADAHFEMQHCREYDYRVVNGPDGPECAADRIACIVAAERLRIQRHPIVLPIH